VLFLAGLKLLPVKTGACVQCLMELAWVSVLPWPWLFLAAVREIVGRGTILGPDPESAIHLFGANFEPMALFAQPAGAFIALGLLLAVLTF
jgi:Na+-translocating ferredoxin:NAD+ oxidoreductase RnfE subunit